MIEAIDNRNMRFFESVADGGNAKPHTRTALKGGLTLMQVIEDARKSLEPLTRRRSVMGLLQNLDQVVLYVALILPTALRP